MPLVVYLFTMQSEVIILSPEMRQNSPTAVSDFKIFPVKKPPLKRGRRGKMGLGGELAYPNVKL